MAASNAFKKKVLESLMLVEEMDPSERADATSFLSETVERLASSPSSSTPKPRTRKKKIKEEKDVVPSDDRPTRRQTQTPKRFSEFQLDESTSKKPKRAPEAIKGKKSVKVSHSVIEEVDLDSLEDRVNYNAVVELTRLENNDLSQFLIVKVEDPLEEFVEGDDNYMVSMEAIQDPDEVNDVVGNLKQIVTIEKEKPRAVKTCTKTSSDVVIVENAVHSEITNQKQLRAVTEATCVFCAKVFATVRQMLDHRDDEHDKVTLCPLCDKSFPNVILLARHAVEHYNETSTSCLVCERDSFKDHKLLLRHSKLCIGKDYATGVLCPWCGHNCMDVHFLREHARFCNGSTPLENVSPITTPTVSGMKVVCDVCNRSLLPMHFIRHRYQHYHTQLLKCRVCCREFREPNSRLRHERFHLDFDTEEEALKVKRDIAKRIGFEQTTAESDETAAEPAIKPQEIDVVSTGCGGELPENPPARVEPKSRHEISRMIYDRLVETKTTMEDNLKPDDDSTESVEDREMAQSIGDFIGEDFESWMKKFTSKADFNCMLCTRTIGGLNFKVHLMAHLDVRPWQCIDCRHAFVTRQHLMSHISVNINPRNIRCLQCPKLFKDMRAMQRHYLTHARKTKDIECGICHKKFLTKRYLRVHEVVHEGGKYRQSQCSFCEEWFSRQYIRDMHQDLVCANNEKKTSKMTQEEFEIMVSEEIVKRKSGGTLDACHICNKTFSAASLLKLHLMKHRDERNFLCELCEKKFLTKGQLQKHQYAVHEANKSVECEVCGKVVKEWYLTRHARTHEINRDRPHKCSTCGMSFMDAKTLRNHAELHERGRKNNCNICKCSFSNPHQLLMHKKKHRSDFAYTCQVCGQGFVSERRLQQHFAVHTRDRQKQHACPLCSHRYSTRRVMTQHALREHGMQLDRYGCVRCGETFGSNKSLCMQHVQACFRSKKMNDRKLIKDNLIVVDPLNNPAQDQIAQEVLTQLSSMAPLNKNCNMVIEHGGEQEVVLENPQPGVQYIIVDPEGNVLETLDVGHGEQVHIETEDVDADNEVVTYSLPIEEEPEYHTVTVVKNEGVEVVEDDVQVVVQDGTVISTEVAYSVDE